MGLHTKTLYKDHVKNNEASQSYCISDIYSTLVFLALDSPSGKMKLGHQSGCSFFMFHDHFVTLWLHYF